MYVSPEVTDYMTMYVQVTTVMAADLVPFMPVIRAAVATGMRDVPNPLYECLKLITDIHRYHSNDPEYEGNYEFSVSFLLKTLGGFGSK